MGGSSIKLKQNREVVLNGEEITRLPTQIDGTNIRIVSSIFLLGKFQIKFYKKKKAKSYKFVNFFS